jgi:hypothetical protein
MNSEEVEKLIKSLNCKNMVKYSLFASEQVFYIYDSVFPRDKIIKKAISEIKKYLKNYPANLDNASLEIADNASRAARYASDYVNHVYHTTRNIKFYAPAYAAYSISSAAYASAYASLFKTDKVIIYSKSAVNTAMSCGKNIKTKIIKYGLTLLKEHA